MTRTCVVFNCRSNLKVKGEDGKQINSKYISCFPFPYIPTDKSKSVLTALKPVETDSSEVIHKKLLTEKWVNNLPNDKSSLMINSYNGVCKYHFDESCFRYSKKISLIPGSIPTIFKNDSQEIIAPLPPKRIFMDKFNELREREQIQKAMEISKETFKKENDLNSLLKIEEILLKSIRDDFVLKKFTGYIYYAKFDFDNSVVLNFVKIYDDLSFSCSFKHNYSFTHIKTRSHLNSITELLDNKPDNSFIKSQINSLLQKLSINNCDKLKILIEDQLLNIDISPNNRYYQPSSLLIYLKIFLYSPKIYKYLRENILYMPHERNIRKIFSNLSVDVQSKTDNKLYLSQKFKNLSKR